MALNWALAQAADECTGGPTPGARALLAWLLESYTSSRSLGIYNCRTVRGGTTTSLHGEGRAVDQGFPLVGGAANPLGHRAIQRVGQHGRRLGIQRAIFDRQLWDARYPTGRRYNGVHPHTDHIHWELTRNAAINLTLATLRAVLGGSTGGITMLARCKHGDGPGDPATTTLQTVLRYTFNIDIGDFGPANDGVDGDYGDATATALAGIAPGNGRSFGPRQYAAILARLKGGGVDAHDHDGRYYRKGQVWPRGKLWTRDQSDARFVNEGSAAVVITITDED